MISKVPSRLRLLTIITKSRREKETGMAKNKLPLPLQSPTIWPEVVGSFGPMLLTWRYLMAEKVNPSGCGGPGSDGGAPLDPTVFLVSLKNAPSLPTADGVGYTQQPFPPSSFPYYTVKVGVDHDWSKQWLSRGGGIIHQRKFERSCQAVT